jgi:hypothetical protein
MQAGLFDTGVSSALRPVPDKLVVREGVYTETELAMLAVWLNQKKRFGQRTVRRNNESKKIVRPPESP